MDAQTRLELIRERLRKPATSVSKPVGLFSASHPELPRPKPRRLGIFRNPNARDMSHGYFPADIVADIPKWVRQADKREVRCSVRRTKKVSPLTVIAEKWEDSETFKPQGIMAG